MNQTETTAPTEAGGGVRIFSSKLHRIQRGHGKAFVDRPPSPPPAPVRRPARVAIMLALAHKIQDAIDRGVVRDCADVAMRLGLSRARISQLLDLILLAPDIQERLLDLTSIDGLEPIAERTLRTLARAPSWAQQRLIVAVKPAVRVRTGRSAALGELAVAVLQG
jgi:hypothetical protein